MTLFTQSGSTLGARCTLGLLSLVAIFPLGCSNMTSTATESAAASPLVRVKGRVHGGNQPVSGATITVYYAGQSGYGSSGTVDATTTTTANDGYGSFTFTPNCPSSPHDPLVYLVATGGNTLNNGSSSNNSAAQFLAAVGPCSLINSSTFVDMSEVTTVATMAALQQYFNPATERFGVDGILLSYTAMRNAMAAIPNLVSTTTGLAVTTLTKTATVGTSSVSVTVTPETAKINTIANIVSACINNNANGDATACTTLKNDAIPPNPATTSQSNGSFPAAPDLLTSLYYMLTNPTNGSSANLNAIYALAPGTGAPYQPTLTSAPTDWTIGVTYSSTSNCPNGDAFFNLPHDLKVDASGGVWIANLDGSNLTQIAFDGTPTTCAPVGSQLYANTIDDQGNVWVGSLNTSSIYRYTPGTGAVLTFTTTAPVYAITADGNHNVYFLSVASGSNSLNVILGGATATVASTPSQIATALGGSPKQIMVGSDGGSYIYGTHTANGTGTVWVSTGQASVYAVSPSTNTSDPTYLNGYVTAPYNVSGDSYGIAIVPGNAGNIFSSAQNTTTIDLLGPSGGSYTEATSFPASGGGLSTPTNISADGASNVWVANSTASRVSEFSNGAVSLTGTTGFVKGGLLGGQSIIVDQGGNVWVSSNTSPNSIVEILGAGVPLYQPASIGIAQLRFQTLP